MPVVANGRQVLLGLVFISVATAGAHAEIVVNGGFETGQFFPWNAPPSVPNQSVFRVSGGGGHTGEYYAKLASTQLRFISQVLPTEAGGDYELSFWLRRPSNFPALFRVRWEGQTVFNHITALPDGANWHQFTVPLHANITGSLLEFGQMDFPGEFHIDDISVVQVPGPGGAVVFAAAGVIVMGRRRR